MNKSWTVELLEADDGSGDLILPFPDDMIADIGWKEGDTVEWVDNKDGTWTLRKKDETKD